MPQLAKGHATDYLYPGLGSRSRSAWSRMI